MAGIAHAALTSGSSPPSPVSAPCLSSFAWALWHRHKIPESVDELTNPYNRRNNSILDLPSSIEVTFPIGQSLRFE
jgi:hypothetical protein